MASTFTWLDYSEREKRRMLDVIDQFKEQDTRDELGIGTVRDAFADIFFPGTSTIQTRARYFLFIPWIYLDLERRQVQSSDVARRARQAEIKLIDVLLDSGDADGTIGLLARAKLKRLPSIIYWQGLRAWGIRRYYGSQEQYHRSLDAWYSTLGRKRRNDDGELVDAGTGGNWHPGLPAAPDDFPGAASFTLTGEEARYLRERILTCAPATLLAFLVDQGERADRVSFPWEHPLRSEFPPPIAEQLAHARNFSELIHSAPLLYNLMLAELLGNAEWVDEYQSFIRDWWSQVESRRGELQRWDRPRFWQIALSNGARVTPQTHSFIDAWLDVALAAPSAKALVADERARILIRERERALKRSLARLDNRRALELWSGAAGTSQLDYRWRTAQTMIIDILGGISA
jgi:hypothetical protein